MFLMTAALFERMLEDLEDALPAAMPVISQAGAAAPAGGVHASPQQALSVRDVARRLEGPARERFLEHCVGLVESLRVEITGLEQLRSQTHLLLEGTERERQDRALDREIERLRAHAGRVDSAIRQARSEQ